MQLDGGELHTLQIYELSTVTSSLIIWFGLHWLYAWNKAIVCQMIVHRVRTIHAAFHLCVGDARKAMSTISGGEVKSGVVESIYEFTVCGRFAKISC